jgi:hypothetical protein
MLKRAAAVIALFLWTMTVSAATLYGTILGRVSTLVEIDPATGALVRTIGSVGYKVNGLTYDDATRTLYATTSDRDVNLSSGLLTINRATGAGTPVGTGAGRFVNVPAANSYGQLYGWTQNDDDLVLWNKVAGTVSVIGDSGVSTNEQSLAFDSSDVLYLLDEAVLYSIGTSTGAAVSIGGVAGITTGIAHHGDFNPDNNRLYAISKTSSSPTANPRDIYVIDIPSRSVVAALPTVDNLHTLAFVPTPPAPIVPVDNPFALLGLGALIAVFARRLVHPDGRRTQTTRLPAE